MERQLDILICPRLKRSTQQYCKKCLYMCSEYGLEKCPRCNEYFDKHWTTTVKPIAVKRQRTI